MNTQNNDNENKLIEEIDKLCNAVAPSRVVLEIKSFETKHEKIILSIYNRFISQFELYFETIVEVSHAINYIDKKTWPKHRATQFMLLVFNLNSLYSSFDRLVKGFYEDCFILLRPIYEAFIKIIHITCFPKDPYATIINKKDQDGRKFNLTNFIKNELRLNWGEYFFFSSFAHANQIKVLKTSIEIQNQGHKEPVALKLQFDQALLEIGMNEIYFILFVYVKLLKTLFITNEIENQIPGAINKINKLIQFLEEGTKFHQKNYFPEVFKDTNDIFIMIERVENSNEDWKIVWKDLRTVSNEGISSA